MKYITLVLLLSGSALLAQRQVGFTLDEDSIATQWNEIAASKKILTPEEVLKKHQPTIDAYKKALDKVHAQEKKIQNMQLNPSLSQIDRKREVATLEKLKTNAQHIRSSLKDSFIKNGLSDSKAEELLNKIKYEGSFKKPLIG